MFKFIIHHGTYCEPGGVSVSSKDRLPNGKRPVFESRYELDKLFGMDRFERVVEDADVAVTHPIPSEPSLRPQDSPEPLGKESARGSDEEPQATPEEPVEPAEDLGTVVFESDRVVIRERKKWFRVFLDGEQHGSATRNREDADQAANDLIEAME